MATAKEMLDRWITLRDSKAATDGAVDATSDELIKVNQEQLLHGMGSDGLPLPEYADVTRRGGYGEKKLLENPLNEGRYDMKKSGYSFDSMYANVLGGEVITGSEGAAQSFQDGTAQNIQDVTGRIFGYYESPYLDEYRKNILYPMIVKIIREQTGCL